MFLIEVNLRWDDTHVVSFMQGEERRAALVARAETASLHEEELNWDSDDGSFILSVLKYRCAEEYYSEILYFIFSSFFLKFFMQG